MDTGGNTIVRTSSELSVGEEIEAWHKGRLFHRGRVAETIPTTDLFWIVDSRTGARKLLDVEALEIVRAEKAVAAETVRPETLRPEALRPEALRPEPARPEPARVDKARVAAPRPSRREPHVVWFSNA
ncbi:hypothetical protein [Arthrobacter oryzae]|uniref:hypothetical protein n=1 Tax=Arthrobacter oryzae TaxID=409290 RepID=UPI0030C9FC39